MEKVSMNEFSLEKKVALITGANGLIGREIADSFASFSANLILLDNTEDEDIDIYAKNLSEKYSVKVKVFHISITDIDKIKHVINEAVIYFGKIDILVNLAAIDAKFDENIKNVPKTAFEDFPIELWSKSIEVNMTGTFLITQQVVKQMLKQKNGNIINVASTYSLVSPNQNLYKFNEESEQLFKPIDYVATKSMIPNFTRYLATFYGKKGIRVNTIVPHGVLNNTNSEFIDNFSKLSPLGRMCNREELRGPFVFLASDASSYMTGSTLVVDGGWTAW
jgi:NAD(P)-dependent dehydrogenase (short-subunit alcohol dehydrogenase family)|tara:strand:- start:2473 stop:3306 length:834 start_codon:yes stop_codon:yes gene_type:complete